MQRRRVVAILGISFLLLLALRTALSFRRFAGVERNFGSIHDGESRSSVIRRLGTPNYHAGKCGVIANSPPTCAIEYVYSHPFAPLLPDYYVVSFSADDQVIAADRLTSP
jgi:hypothetical protein